MVDWVEMKHPDIEGTALVTSVSFERLHRRKGWMLVDEPKEPKPKPKPKPKVKKPESPSE